MFVIDVVVVIYFLVIIDVVVVIYAVVDVDVVVVIDVVAVVVPSQLSTCSFFVVRRYSSS